jgi:hypothetical protein
VVGHRHHRRAPILRAFLAIDRVAERARGAFADRFDHFLDRGAVGVDPRLLSHPEHGLEAISAEARVRTDGAVVEDGDAFARERHTLALVPVRNPLVGKSVRAVSAIAERLPLRVTAPA